jgi:hypothetical protein
MGVKGKGKMEQAHALKLANALADLTAEEANTVISISDALRARAVGVEKPRQKKQKRAKKQAAASNGTGKRRGRPKGSKNKPKEETTGSPEAMEPEEATIQ